MQGPLTISPPESRIRAPRPSTRFTAIAALLVGAICFGLGTVATKGAMDGIPPLTLAGARFGIAALVLFAFCRVRGVSPVYDSRSVLLGLTGVAAPFALQNVGLQDMDAGTNLLLIEGGVPVLTALFGLAFLKERVGGACLCGIVLGVAGVVAVAVREITGGSPVRASVLALLSAAAFAAYTVLGRKIFRGGFSLPVLTGGTAIGTLMLVPFASAEIATGGLPRLDPGDLWLLLFLGLVGSAVTQLLWAHGMAHLDAAEVGAFGTFIPVAGIAAAALFLGEAVTTTQLAGMALIVAGLTVTAQATELRRPSVVRWPRRAAPVAVMPTALEPFTDIVVSTTAPLTAAADSPLPAIRPPAPPAPPPGPTRLSP